MNAVNSFAVLNGFSGHTMQRENRTTRVNGDDVDYMQAFPADKKQEILDTILSRESSTSVDLAGPNQYEKTILRLRKEGYRMIDFQPQEFALTSVWCKKSRTMIGVARFDIAMLLWMVEGDATSVRYWRI